jgi:uncharacterized protein (TIGR03435 family)
MEKIRQVILTALLAMAVRGQAPAPPAFEAAAIKINNSPACPCGISSYPARIKVINSTLKFCVQVAWDVKDFQVSGAAGWMDTEHYDIDAVAANPFTREESRKMMQALLADRFGLVVHSETQDRPGYVLVPSRNGPKLPPPIEDPSVMFSRTPSGDRTLKATNLSMKRFAEALSMALGKIVVDQTGIEGQYDVSFQWTPDASEPRMSKSGEPLPPLPADTVPGPSIFTALQEKLGLRLESRKVPVEVIVIEHANRPSEN